MIFRKSYLVFFVLLAGCRSEQAAFQFGRPTGSAPVTTTEAAAPTPPAPEVAVSAPSDAPRTVTGPHTPRIAHRAINPPLPIVFQRNTTVRKTVRPTVVTPPHRQFSRPRQAWLEHKAAFVLGLALVAGGIVAGILLGGWLGLGVGALVVLLGYYFVGIGIGGKHAWLEVFQEFFNM